MEKKPSGNNQTWSVEQGFWEAYQRYVLERGVSEKNAKWLTNWIKQFARYMKDVPLHDSAESDVKGFLRQLDTRDDIEKWQVKQARSALRLLFKDFLQVQWASQKAGARPDKQEASKTLPIKGPSLPQFKGELYPVEKQVSSSTQNQAILKAVSGQQSAFS